jgi:phosphate transport system substrate-binding protein
VRRPFAPALVLVLALVGAACGKGTTVVESNPTPGSESFTGVSLTGAGATFPAPLYQYWASEYQKKTRLQVNYQSIGSGGGIQQITARTVDFGASDAPMKDEELAKATGAILHIPMVFGAVVVTFNLSEVTEGLKLTPDTLAAIFLGKVKKWNAPAIAADNAGTTLPASDITVVHRSDGSGTTSIFTNYLKAVNPEWASKVGAGKEVAWPVGLGGKGNDGVTALVKQTPGAVGYVELVYAGQNKLPMIALRNAAGKFITPDLASTTAAARGVAIPDDLRFSMVNSSNADAYPISGATWILIYQQQTDATKGKALAAFLKWALTDGQKLAPSLSYAPLSKELVAKAEAKLKTITFTPAANASP